MQVSSLRVAAKLKDIRKRLRLSQQRIADAMGCEPSFVSKIENGKALPSIKTVFKMENNLDIEGELSSILLKETHALASNAKLAAGALSQVPDSLDLVSYLQGENFNSRKVEIKKDRKSTRLNSSHRL